MKIRDQWLVMYKGVLSLLVLTEQDGYFVQKNGVFKSLGNFQARDLIYKTDQDV